MVWGEPVELTTMSASAIACRAVVKANGAPAEFGGQVQRPVVGAVGDEHGARAFLGEVADAGLAHLARADDHHRLLGKVLVENALGQLDGDAADGGRAPANAGLRPNLFGRLQRRLEQPVGHAPGQLRFLGRQVGLLDLAGDLGLADHHRIQAAGHREEMLHGLGPFLDVKVGGKINVARRELLEEPVHVAVDLRGHAIDLHPVAGGEQNHFRQVAAQLEAAAVTAQPGGMHRQLLAQFDRRGLVAQSGNEEFHAAVAGGGLNARARILGQANLAKSCDLSY